MVVNKKSILNLSPRKIATIPDTPIDLRTSIKGDPYYIFSSRLKRGEVHYTFDTHSSVGKIVREVWNMAIIDYEDVKRIPNPYKSLDEVLDGIEGKRIIAGVGRSALPYLLHYLMLLEDRGESEVIYVYIVTKWEKTGQQITNPRTPVIYSTIKNLANKHGIKKIIIIDDVMATGFTLGSIYSNLQNWLKDAEKYLVPVALDISILFTSNLSNSGRHLPIDKVLDEFFTKDLKYFQYGLSKREWKTILEDFSRKVGKGYNKKNLEELAEVLSCTYPAIVINSFGGETFPVTHLIRDTEEEAAKKRYYSEDITDLMNRQAIFFQNPLLGLLDKYKHIIYHAPRTL